MIFVLFFFLAAGLAAIAGPALILGLAVGLLSASLRLPTRIALLLIPALGLSLAWVALLHGSYLLPVALLLVVAATATSGAAGIGWTEYRRRTRGVPRTAVGR